MKEFTKKTILIFLCGISSLLNEVHGSPDIDNSKCSGSRFCAPAGQCRALKGEPRETCGSGYVCCKVSATCDSVITTNMTVFENPHKVKNTMRCIAEVKKMPVAGGICQLRLDMVRFNTAPPHALSGQCVDDSFVVSGQDILLPVLCGLNKGQHMYVDVSRTQSIYLNMNLGVAEPKIDREWRIKVTQIPCNSANRLAPAGCLQYHEDYSGHISSFNYQGSSTKITSYPLIESYSICFRESCLLKLSKDGPFGLSANADTNSIDVGGVGAYKDENCFLPQNPSWVDRKSYLGIDNIKFCGQNFPQVYTSLNPVNRISVVFAPESQRSTTDHYEGFRLLYQFVCTRGVL